MLTKLLPHLAVKAQSKLRVLLPDFLTILARAICWRTSMSLVEQEATLEGAERRLPSLREDLDWEQLGSPVCYFYLWAISDNHSHSGRFSFLSPT